MPIFSPAASCPGRPQQCFFPFLSCQNDGRSVGHVRSELRGEARKVYGRETAVVQLQSDQHLVRIPDMILRLLPNQRKSEIDSDSDSECLFTNKYNLKCKN